MNFLASAASAFAFACGLRLGALLSRVDVLGDVAGERLRGLAGGFDRELAVGAERLPLAASVLEPQLDDETDLAVRRDAHA